MFSKSYDQAIATYDILQTHPYIVIVTCNLQYFIVLCIVITIIYTHHIFFLFYEISCCLHLFSLNLADI